jgi:Ca-activated chloride channel family protein
MMKTHERARAMGLALLLLAPAGAAAQGWIDPLPRSPDWGVVKLSTDVRVSVEGRVAQVVVEEWFENRGGAMGEGDYMYPLPGEAVFSNFSLYQGDQELRGETMDAGEARAIYEEIVRRKRDPALIELVGHGLVRARVFPIQPGERRRITLRYTQVLERAGDAVQFRYGAGRRSPGPLVRPLPPEHPGDPDGARVTFTLDADAGAWGDPFSPTHDLEVERDDGRLRVRPDTPLAGDFSVFLPVAGETVGLSLATHRPGGEDGYFMLTLSPGTADGGATPRDVTAVVDVSGSMSGAKLEQTRAALRQLLGSLGPQDRFRLIAFSNRVRTTGDGWSGATPEELREARRWIDGLQADGGTNIADALEEALGLATPEDRLAVVVFLTDGLPTVGERNPERIAEAAESILGGARVFAFGVGYDVNTYLLDRLGEAGRGSTSYVEPGEDVERALSTLAAKITHPVLTDLEIAGAPVRLEEIYPGELPDLFAGEELVVFGRYDGSGEGRVSVRGRRAGRTETFAVAAGFPGSAGANDYIPRLWASRKLGELTRQIRLNGPDPELVEAVRSTALRYGLLSEYTSYLVQEPGMVADGRRMPLPPGAPVAMDQAAMTQNASGQAAVRASERARVRREVASAADLAQAEMEVAEEMAKSGARVVAGRTFHQEGDGWVESPRADGQEREDVAIALYSAAYFALLDALPELRPVVSELERVTVSGREVRIRFDDEGASTLGEREVRHLVERFRSR